MIAKTPITFRFGYVDQDIGEKHVRPGQLTRLENARQVKKHDYEPRSGFGRTAFVPAAGEQSWRGPPDSYVMGSTRLVFEGEQTIAKSGLFPRAFITADNNWRNVNGSNFTGYRPFPTSDYFIEASNYGQPQLVRAGTNDWLFVTTTTGFTYNVRDFATSRTVLAKTSVAVSGITKLVVVQDGTNLWAFSVSGGTSITSHRFSVSTPSTSVVTTTYQTVVAAEFRDIDAEVFDDLQIFVVAAGINAAADGIYSHSVLDKTTRAAAAAPAPVTTTVVDTSGMCGGVSILQGGGALTSAYYSIWVPSAATANTDLIVHQVTRSTNAIAATSPVLRTIEGREVPASMGWIASGNPMVISSGSPGSLGLTNDSSILYGHSSTSMAAWTNLPRGYHTWIASKPFQIPLSNRWFYLTGSAESGLDGTSTAAFQRNAYHLRSSIATVPAGSIVAQTEYGLAGDYYNNARHLATTANRQPVTFKPVVAGNVVFIAGISSGSAMRMKFDFDATYGPGVLFRDKMIVPGPIPLQFGVKDTIGELTPLLPPNKTFGALTPTGITDPVGIQVVFRGTDSAGVKSRSIPSPVMWIAEADLPYTARVSTITHSIGDQMTAGQIEIYMTDPDSTTPVLRYVRDNSPTTEAIQLVLNRSAYDSVDPEPIYTTGGALAAFPAPACRNVQVWRNRVILSGTSRLGQILPSMESEDGTGLRFNSVNSSFWRDTATDILRMEPVSSDVLAVMSASGVAIVTGNGPNGRGQGPYTVKTLPEKKGILNARAACNGRDGVYYQATDLRYYLINGPSVEDIGLGAESYTSPVSTTLHSPGEQRVYFYLEDGKILALDYSRASTDEPRGQWSVWFSSGLTRAYGAIVVNGAPEHMDSDGARRTYQSAFTDTNSSSVEQNYSMVLASGELAPFDLGHQFRLATVIVHGEFVGSTSLTLDLTMDRGNSTAGTYTNTRTITAAPFQRYFNPNGGDRIQSVKAVLTVPALNGGGRVSGVTLVAQDRGMKSSNFAQRVQG